MKNGETCLHWAVHRHFNRELLQLIIDHGGKLDAVDTKGRTALQLAITKRHPEAFNFLLSAGADTNIRDEDGDTALHNALIEGYDESYVRALIAHGATVDTVSNRLLTALSVACICRQVESVKVLLAAGADPNITDVDDDSSLHIAVYRGCNIETLQALVNHGANMDRINSKEESALLLACRQERIEAAKFLLEAGASPTMVDKDGATCLHWGIHRHFNSEVLQVLIDHGVPLDIVDHKCRTALQLAVSSEVS